MVIEWLQSDARTFDRQSKVYLDGIEMPSTVESEDASAVHHAFVYRENKETHERLCLMFPKGIPDAVHSFAGRLSCASCMRRSFELTR